MVRTLSMALLFALVPVTPALAVVAIAETVSARPVHTPAPAPAPRNVTGLTFGEAAAALAGIAVIALAFAGSRQPHSVSV
jgi:hypothetical protein